MLSGLLARALRLSPKNATGLQVPFPCRRGSHQLLCRPRHTTPNRTLLSTLSRTRLLHSSYFSRSYPPSGPTPLTTTGKSVFKQLPRFFSSNGGGGGHSQQQPGAEQQLPVLSPPAVGKWLMLSSTLVIAVIVVGGVTRLTESGLSITEWRPVTGVLPPLSLTEWEDEFEKYRATPEFRLCVAFFLLLLLLRIPLTHTLPSPPVPLTG